MGGPGMAIKLQKPFAFVKSQHFAELFKDRRATLALLNFLHQHRKRVGLHAAGGALAAGFGGKEAGDAHQLVDDGIAFADDMDDAAAEHGTGFAHGVGFQRRIDLVRAANRRMTASRA